MWSRKKKKEKNQHFRKMSEKHPKADKGTLNQKTQYRRSFVGPGCHEQCFSNKIASIKCEVLQPQPKSPVRDSTVAASHASRPETLLPSEIRLLCLWKSKEENEYHLTVIKEDKDQVFLDLPLSKLLNGEISYNINRQWHEVTVLSDRPQQPRRFVFRLESSSADHADCKDFNRHLETVFEEILQSGVGRENNTVTLSSSADQNGAQLGGGASLTQTTAPVPPVAMAELSSAASSEMASRQPMSKPQVTFPAKDVEQMALTLATSIRTGDVQRAMRFATLLAQAQTNLTVNYDVAAEEEKAREQEISATVVVEDREMACLPLDIKVKPSDTISDLKRSFWDKHGFPVEVQKWIIGKRIPGDEETLSKCDITSSGHTLYLYLLNIRAVDPASRGDANRQYWQGQSSAGNAGGNTASRSKQDSDYETMTFPIAPVSGTPLRGASTHSLSSVDLTLSSSQQQRNQGLLLPLTSTGGAAGGTARQQSQLSATSSSASLSAVSFGLPDIRGNLEPLSGPTSAQQQRGGMEVVLNGVGQMVLTGGGGVGVSENHPLQGSPVDGQPSQELESAQGWQCPQCTLINQPTRPGCEACGSPRPPGYQVPSDFIVSEEERHRLERERQMEAFLKQKGVQEREKNYQQLLQADSSDLVSNTQIFTCPICFDDIEVGEGIVLRDCLHQFCRTCLTDTVRLAEEAELKCPYQDDSYMCNALLMDREVRALVPDHVYERYLRRSLDLAESQAANSYHCKTPDCRGWCIYEDMVNFFRCPVCRHENCLTCRAIHENQNCKQYQEDLRVRASNDKAAQKTQIMLQDMLDKGEAMHCPQCEVIVQKKDGCDWIRCSFCKTEICWVTKGPRWGPKGEGDSSGGCKCRVGGQRCHPKCNNCH